MFLIVFVGVNVTYDRGKTGLKRANEQLPNLWSPSMHVLLTGANHMALKAGVVVVPAARDPACFEGFTEIGSVNPAKSRGLPANFTYPVWQFQEVL